VGQALPPAIPTDVPAPIQPQSNQQPIPEIGFVPPTAPPPAPSPRPLAPNPRPLAPGPQFR
jgi:hypothetical protein